MSLQSAATIITPDPDCKSDIDPSHTDSSHIDHTNVDHTNINMMQDDNKANVDAVSLEVSVDTISVNVKVQNQQEAIASGVSIEPEIP